jgi:hypothetical protein
MLLLISMLFVQTAFYQKPLWTIMELDYINSHYALGTGLLGLGDINNDGKPDFAVSAGNIGKTFIYFGGKGILDTTPDLIIEGGGAMAMGDMNGDGKKDLIVASIHATYSTSPETLYVYYGKTPNPLAIDTVPDLIITSGDAIDGGIGSFAVGDLNNDGFDDLVVGYQNYGIAQGKVNFYMGKPKPNGIADYSSLGDTISSSFGSTIKIADINGDGIKDLAIGSDRFKHIDSMWIEDGILDIYYGKSGWNFNKNNYDQRFDASNTGISDVNWFNLLDVNGDGKADISVINSSISACFFYGQSDSVRIKPNMVIQSDTAVGSFFYCPAIDIGDINGDGKRDFALLSTDGGPDVCINVFLGGPFPSKQSMAVRCRGGVDQGTAFQNISPLGDINGDGINDFAASAPYDFLLDILPQDGYVVILRGDTTLVTSVPTPNKLVPTSDELKQNYPNPFNPSTTIEYTLQKQEYVSIKIYDITGKEITSLVNSEQNAGNYRVIWNGKTDRGTTVASGVYFYQLRTPTMKATKKIIHLQ